LGAFLQDLGGGVQNPDQQAYDTYEETNKDYNAAQQAQGQGGAFTPAPYKPDYNPQADMSGMSGELRDSVQNQNILKGLEGTDPDSYIRIGQQLIKTGKTEQGLAFTQQGMAIREAQNKTKEGFSLKKDEIQYDADGNIIAQNTPKENDVLTAKDRYKTVGGALYDVQLSKWLTPPKDPNNINTTPIKTINAKGEPVTQLITEGGKVLAEFPAPTDSGGMSAALEKDQMASLTASNEALTTDRRVSQTISGLEGIPDFGGGLPLSFEDVIKDNAGWRDVKSAILTEAKGFRAENAMRYLPPGPASDKDVALALSGQPPENASRAEWLGYLKGIQKLSRLEANYFRDRDAFVSNNGDLRGFGQQQEAKRIDTAILNLPSKGDGTTPLTIYNAVPSNTPEKAKIKKDFIDKYGFDPDRRSELQSALTNLGL
jgi:hypothetical protein